MSSALSTPLSRLDAGSMRSDTSLKPPSEPSMLAFLVLRVGRLGLRVARACTWRWSTMLSFSKQCVTACAHEIPVTAGLTSSSGCRGEASACDAGSQGASSAADAWQPAASPAAGQPAATFPGRAWMAAIHWRCSPSLSACSRYALEVACRGETTLKLKGGAPSPARLLTAAVSREMPVFCGVLLPFWLSCSQANALSGRGPCQARCTQQSGCPAWQQASHSCSCR